MLIEGTYTSVKGRDFVDYWISIGIPKDVAEKMMGSHWTLKVWKDAHIWGFYLTCRELPHLNILETFLDGVEKKVDHPMFGGQAKWMFTKMTSGLGFTTVCESDEMGKMTMEDKFSAEGLQISVTSKGKSLTQLWERCIKVEGSYVVEKLDNIEAFFKAAGDSFLVPHCRDYKIHVGVKGKTFTVSECFGDLGMFSNEMELDAEVPFKAPGDLEGTSPSHVAIMTKTGVGKFVMMFKSKDSGVSEEWKMTFSDHGLVMTGTELKSGVSCVFHMKRFVELGGSFKMLTMMGFEKFVEAMGGLTKQEAMEMSRDPSFKMEVSEMMNGTRKILLSRKKSPMELVFKLNDECTFYHPFLHENVKMHSSMLDHHKLCLTMKTSKGILLYKFYFNNTFVTLSVSVPAAHLRYKIMFERISF